MPYDTVGKIMDYENGKLGEAETIELFSFLLKTGLAWSLQGSYSRAASQFIESGVLDKNGNQTGV